MGQITVSPSTCTFTMQKGGPLGSSCEITRSGSGAWTASTSASYQWVDQSGTAETSGSGAGISYLRLIGGTTWINAAVGVYTDTTNIIIAGTTLTITTNVVIAPKTPFYTNTLGSLDSSFGSTTSGYMYADQVLPPNARPGGTQEFANPGNTYTDATFGTPSICVVAKGTGGLEYQGLSLISSDNAYVLNTGNNIYKTNCSDTAVQWALTGQNYGPWQFSRVTSNVVYGIGNWSRTSLYKLTLTGGGGITNNGAIWTEPHGKLIGMGGTNPVQAGDWICIITDDTSWFTCVDLDNVSDTKTYDLSGLSPPLQGTGPGGQIDFVMGPWYDAPTNRYWASIMVSGSTQTHKMERFFSFAPGDTLMTYEGGGPNYHGENGARLKCSDANASSGVTYYGCIVTSHDAVVHYAGSPYMVMPASVEFVTFTPKVLAFKLSTMQSDPLNGGLPYSSDGGLRIVGNIGSHIGAAVSTPYIMLPRSRDPTRQGYTITDATGSSPVTITMSPDPGWSGGQSVLCGGALGMTGIVGVFSIASSLGSAQYTISTATSGTYTASSGACVNNTTLDQYPNEIQVTRMCFFGPCQTERVAHHFTRTYLTTDTFDSYLFPVISTDGSMLCWHSNGGYPKGTGINSELRVLCAANRLTATQDNELSIAGRTVDVSSSGTSATFTVLAPSTDDVAISIFPDVSMTSATSTCTATGPATYPTARQTTCTGLSIGVSYVWRALAVNKYVAVGQFTAGATAIAPSLGGNSRTSGNSRF